MIANRAAVLASLTALYTNCIAFVTGIAVITRQNAVTAVSVTNVAQVCAGAECTNAAFLTDIDTFFTAVAIIAKVAGT